MSKKIVDIRSAKVFEFLDGVSANNNREWFNDNRMLYDEAHAAFSDIVTSLIARISEFDPEIGLLSAKDCTYRIYRDIRFSNDKSPFKTHMGAYINSHGKKSMHGGYYLHFERGHCLVAGGSYCLDAKVLKAVRESIFDNVEEFSNIVEAPDFKALFPTIGEERLKTAPKGFPKDFPHMEYLQPKDYSVATYVSDNDFLYDGWQDKVADIFKTMKPMLDFVNAAIDDFE